jgi:hypothetical protein
VNKRSRSSFNDGIQANTVTADVLAVGRGAHAKKVVLGHDDRQQLIDAVATLRRGIEGLQLSVTDRQIVTANVAALERVTQEDPEQARGRIAGLLSTLKTVGVAVSDVATLIEPIRKIVGLLHLGIGV